MSILSFLTSRKNTKTIDMVLSHDGVSWTATDKNIHLAAGTLPELDRMISASLQDELAEHGSLDVFMAFDNEVIPHWIRPYMNHYFNRILELPLRQS